MKAAAELRSTIGSPSPALVPSGLLPVVRRLWPAEDVVAEGAETATAVPPVSVAGPGPGDWEDVVADVKVATTTAVSPASLGKLGPGDWVARGTIATFSSACGSECRAGRDAFGPV